MKQEEPTSPAQRHPGLQRLADGGRDTSEDSFRDGLESSEKKTIKKEGRAGGEGSSVRYRSLLGQRRSNRQQATDRSLETSEEYSLHPRRTGKSFQTSICEQTRASLEPEVPLLTSLKERLQRQRGATRPSHQPHSSSGLEGSEAREASAERLGIQSRLRREKEPGWRVEEAAAEGGELGRLARVLGAARWSRLARGCQGLGWLAEFAELKAYLLFSAFHHYLLLLRTTRLKLARQDRLRSLVGSFGFLPAPKAQFVGEMVSKYVEKKAPNLGDGRGGLCPVLLEAVVTLLEGMLLNEKVKIDRLSRPSLWEARQAMREFLGRKRGLRELGAMAALARLCLEAVTGMLHVQTTLYVATMKGGSGGDKSSIVSQTLNRDFGEVLHAEQSNSARVLCVVVQDGSELIVVSMVTKGEETPKPVDDGDMLLRSRGALRTPSLSRERAPRFKQESLLNSSARRSSRKRDASTAREADDSQGFLSYRRTLEHPTDDRPIQDYQSESKHAREHTAITENGIEKRMERRTGVRQLKPAGWSSKDGPEVGDEGHQGRPRGRAESGERAGQGARGVPVNTEEYYTKSKGQTETVENPNKKSLFTEQKENLINNIQLIKKNIRNQSKIKDQNRLAKYNDSSLNNPDPAPQPMSHDVLKFVHQVSAAKSNTENLFLDQNALNSILKRGANQGEEIIKRVAPQQKTEKGQIINRGIQGHLFTAQQETKPKLISGFSDIIGQTTNRMERLLVDMDHTTQLISFNRKPYR